MSVTATEKIIGEDRVYVMRHRGREFVAIRLDVGGTVLLEAQNPAGAKATLIRQVIREAIREAIAEAQRQTATFSEVR